jgi:hypothetical protein
MSKITPVPNGPLVKKKGPFKGSTLKNGGTTTKQTTIKPDYSDMVTTKRGFSKDKPYTPTARDSSYYRQGFDMATKGKPVIPAYDMKTTQGMRGYYEATNRGLNPSKKPKPKAKAGAMIKRADGSYSKRGLWDNLRSKAAQNKKTGAKPKAPTKAMLTQEKKIKSKGK